MLIHLESSSLGLLCWKSLGYFQKQVTQACLHTGTTACWHEGVSA